MKRAHAMVIAAPLASCIAIADNGATIPPSAPNRVVIVEAPSGPLSDCAWRELDRRNPTLVSRSEDRGVTTIRMQEPGLRHWELQIESVAPARSRVTFRAITPLMGPDYWWNYIAEVRLVCGIIA